MLKQRQVDDRMVDTPGVTHIEDRAGRRRRPAVPRRRMLGSAPRPTFSKPNARVASPTPVSTKPREVERPAAGFLEIADEQVDEDDAQDADRDVDEEDPAPRPIGDDEAAERRAHDRADQRRDADIGHRTHQIGFFARSAAAPAARPAPSAPRPCPGRMRAATRAASELAIPQPIEPKVKTTIATLNTRRAPNRSAVQPLIGMNTARLSK